MPIYAYRCPACGRDQDQFSTIADRDNGPACCDATMARQLTACMVSVRAFENYRCAMTDQVIKSESQRRYTMEQNNVVDAREYDSQWARQRVKKAEETAEAKRYYDALPDAVKSAVTVPPAMA